MAKEIKDDKLLNVKVWRYLVNFWSLVLYGTIIADFFTRNELTDFLGPISAIYIAVLAIYTAQKEFERWHDYHLGRHPGEMYVFVWTALIISLLVFEILYHDTYKIPEEAVTSYIVVIGILAITKRSKKNYKLAKKESKK